MEILNEEQIVESCQSGRTSDFGLLYDAYIERIYKFVYYKTHHKETAEDIVSRVFIKALKNISSLDLSKGSFQSWIYTIARNSVIDHYRTDKKDANVDDIWDLSEDLTIERDLDMKNKLSDVEKYLADLKSEHREIVIMRVWQGMSYREIAESLGKSESSCKMCFSRVIRKLRKEMPLALFIAFLLQ